MPKPDYDTTLARIAGNIASGLAGALLRTGTVTEELVAVECVSLARAIVAEVRRTEPQTLAGLTENHGNASESAKSPARSIEG